MALVTVLHSTYILNVLMQGEFKDTRGGYVIFLKKYSDFGGGKKIT
jgi:hypothetical protein